MIILQTIDASNGIDASKAVSEPIPIQSDLVSVDSRSSLGENYVLCFVQVSMKFFFVYLLHIIIQKVSLHMLYALRNCNILRMVHYTCYS